MPSSVITCRADRYRVFYAALESELHGRGTVMVTARFFGFARGATAQVLASPLMQPEIRPLVRDVVDRWVLGTRAPVTPETVSPSPAAG